ncbi:non-specific lipid-transfer protein 2-like isoform X2 [Capsicum annuum]|uniref:non-specific lipid-transfer protein 2-like isoform X2 n=1 Tax=Capsicum annuum TaxID=4072 RepID=UPI001FB0D717|nr:non-specific lipid-transfer protein 2-like isoform X2 [Capsicum annuum]
MEMAGKIACFVLLCMVVVAPYAAALSCGQVTSAMAPCVPYLTPADRKTACTCLKSAANAIKGIDAGKAAGLPAACGVNIPYKISPSTDCSKVQ